jgi:cytochrome c5
VVAVALFLLFWIVAGLGLLFVAMHGGPKAARAKLQSQSRRGRKGATTVLLALYVLFGVAVPVGLLIGSHHNANAQVSGSKLTGDAKRGREIFGASCGSCHTLSAANAVGKVGPNLDVIKPTKARVLQVLKTGLQQGNGTMPAGLLPDSDDARAVADFIAQVEHPPPAH